MPSELNEPTLEELSAYVDHELDAGAQARVADHIAGCAECRTRLDGMRQTAYAVRALPMETPARAFTIPAQRRQSFRWAPVGWVGGVAAAFLIIIVGVQQLHGPAPGGSATTATQYNAGTSRNNPAAPLSQPGILDQRAGAASTPVNASTVVDPLNSSHHLTLSTDAPSYRSTGTITLHVALQGLAAPSPPETADAAGVRLLLVRDSYGVELNSPFRTIESATMPTFDAIYPIQRLRLPNPPAGTYKLLAIWTIPGQSGATLVASVPITIGG